MFDYRNRGSADYLRKSCSSIIYNLNDKKVKMTSMENNLGCKTGDII